MSDYNNYADDTTKCLLEPDEKYGTFEPDPNDPFIQRYIPSDAELDRLNNWFADEWETAWLDDQQQKDRKLALLNAYRGIPDAQQQILTIPLVKRAVKRTVAYAKGKILGQKPILTIKPTSNETIPVLVEDQQFGTVPLPKSSEEIAQALEWWMDWKLRNRIDFDDVVEIAALEAKRGQTPTWIKVVHKSEKRTIKAPRYEKKGPLAVTFKSKDDLEVVAGDPTRLVNVSTYSMLMPAEETDAQESRWLAEDCRTDSEGFRRGLYNGDYFLIDKSDWEESIENGMEEERPEHEVRRAESERKVPSRPKKYQPIWLVWFTHTCPMKQTLVTVDESGQPTEKTIKTYQEYEMVGHFHKKLGKFLSLIRNPFDHGCRPYVPVYDRKEPFRASGESLAEDVINHQRAISQLLSLEIRSGVIANTPIFYAEPGSIAGDWLTDNPEVNPGDIIPRLRKEEIEKDTLGAPHQSLVPTIGFVHNDYEKNVAIGDLQLGLNVPSRTPASSVSQILNQGETDAQDFLERFCDDLVDALVLYIKTVQQYLRTGEVIPFDPETKAAVMAALGQPAEQDELNPDATKDLGKGIPVRFPMDPITDQFTFSMTAVSGETQQADFEKYVSFKQIVDQDGEQMAKIIGPMASGALPPSIVEFATQQVERSQKLMKTIGDLVAKDGSAYAIPKQVIDGIKQEAAQMAMMKQSQPQQPPPPQIKINVSAQADPVETAEILQKAGIEVPSVQTTQGAGPGGGMAGGAGNGGGMGGPVPEQGVPQGPPGNQAPPPSAPVGPPQQ